MPSARKQQVHRLRKDLKASGDFLGVQGVNPATGQLDVLTPTTSSKSTVSSGGPSAVPGSAVHGSLPRYGEDKEQLRRQQSLVRWRKDSGQWSSAAEPRLSPIAQSSDPARSPTPGT